MSTGKGLNKIVFIIDLKFIEDNFECVIFWFVENDVNKYKHDPPEGDRFLILIVPCASQLSGLIPDFLDLRVVLHNNGVLEVGSGAGVSAIAVQTVF